MTAQEKCRHQELVFKMGDYIIHCANCQAGWRMDDPSLSNVGIGGTLTGEVRVEPAE